MSRISHEKDRNKWERARVDGWMKERELKGHRGRRVNKVETPKLPITCMMADVIAQVIKTSHAPSSFSDCHQGTYHAKKVLLKMHGGMDRWIDGWMGRSTVGWIDGWMDIND